MNKFYIFFSLLFLLSCEDNFIQFGTCSGSDMGITADNMNTKFGFWNSRYSDDTLEIIFQSCCPNGGNPFYQYGFVFKKLGDCLSIDYGYFQDFNDTDELKNIKNIQVLSFKMQNYIADRHISGKINFRNHNDQVIEYEFYVDINSSNSFNFDALAPSKTTCIDQIAGEQIDIDNDGTADFELKTQDLLYNNPDASFYGVAIVPLNDNAVLKASSNAVPVEPPFTTENKSAISASGAQNNIWLNLGILATHDTPLDRFNYWVYDQYFRYYNSNNRTSLFSNTTDDYIMVSVFKNGENHYGWLKLAVNFTTCTFSISDSYLNPNPDEHVSVN